MPRDNGRIRNEAGLVNQVGERVRERRRALSYSQEELGNLLTAATNDKWQADRREVLHIESGKRIVSDLEIIELAKALECEPCWLLLGDS